MRIRWSSLARAALYVAAAAVLDRAPPPAAGQTVSANTPHETPRFSLSAALVMIGLVIAGLAATQGVSRYQQHEQTLAIANALTRGDPKHAPELMIRYGCAGCHTIPGVPGADGAVGPILSQLRARVYIAGVAPNTGANLVRWITDPQSFSPRTAMPRTGVDEAEARQIAAWLYAH